jgi:hypothetical protein
VSGVLLSKTQPVLETLVKNNIIPPALDDLRIAQATPPSSDRAASLYTSSHAEDGVFAAIPGPGAFFIWKSKVDRGIRNVTPSSSSPFSYYERMGASVLIVDEPSPRFSFAEVFNAIVATRDQIIMPTISYSSCGQLVATGAAKAEKSFAPHYNAIEAMAGLQDGWDTYDAPAPNATARYYASKVLDHLLKKDLEPARVRPSAEGGVAISFAAFERRYADIECFNSGEILAVTSDRRSEPVVWTVGAEYSLDATIDRILAFIR